MFICQKQLMTDILCGTPDRHILVPRAPPKIDEGTSKGYQMKLLAKCLVHVYMSKTTNDRHFVWWGTPDRHILVPHPQS